MSETEKCEYAMHNWTDVSAAQRQEIFSLIAQRNRKREEQRQARIRQQSTEHQYAVREKLDKQHAKRKRMCELVIVLFMGCGVVWTVGDLRCRIRSGVTSAKAIEKNAVLRVCDGKQCD